MMKLRCLCVLGVVALLMATAPQARAAKITIDEVVQILLLDEAGVQSMEFDVVKSPGLAGETRGTAKWQRGERTQQIYTTDGNGDPLANAVKEVTNSTSILEVGLDGLSSYWENAFSEMNGDLLSVMRGVATDPQAIWVFASGKTIMDEAVDNLYTIKAIGGPIEIRLNVNLAMKVVTRMEKYHFGTLKSTADADDFVLVGTIYLPGTTVVDSDVTDADPPITFNYSNHVLNPVFDERTFEMPQ